MKPTLLSILLPAALSLGCGGSLGGLFSSMSESEEEKPAKQSIRERLENLSTVDCKTLPSMIEEARKGYLNADNVSQDFIDPEKYGNVVNALAKCGESKVI